MVVETPVYYAFKERPAAGQKQRRGSGNWEQLVNKQQRSSVKVYDRWAAGIKRDIKNRALRGQTIAQMTDFLTRQMPILEEQLIETTNKGILSITKTAAGSHADLPSVKALAQDKIRDNAAMVSNALIPAILTKLTLALIQGKALDRNAMNLAVNATRVMPAQYAGGGAWVFIFETQQKLGGIRENERKAQGLDIEPVRWVLDPAAIHCVHSPGFFGCSELAGEYPEGWKSLPTVPAGQVTCRGNALLPGNIVDANLIEVASRMNYSGPALKLITQSGIEITITANHPILTPNGWLRAKFLNKGDYVINSTVSQLPMVIVDDNHQNVPAFIEKIWDAFTMVSTVYTSPLSPVMTNDFHGDGRFMDGNVDIVLANGQLRGELYSNAPQSIYNSSFSSRLLATRFLSTDSAPVQIDRSAFTVTDSTMTSGNLVQSLFFRHQKPFNCFSFASGTKVNTLSFECIGDSPAAYTEIARQLQDTFSRLVTIDKLVDVIEFNYTGQAYDLQTEGGYYLANIIPQRQGIVLSNCRCHIEVKRDGQWKRGVYDD